MGPGPSWQIEQTGAFFIIDAQSGEIVDQVDTGIPPAMMAFRDIDPLAVIPSPKGRRIGTRHRAGFWCGA